MTEQGHNNRRFSTQGESLYLVLNLPKTATADDIRKTYRKLALKYHPDKNPAPEALEKFKEINRAHSVLSDLTKRNIYDTYGSFGLYVAEHLGEDYVQAYFMLSNKWVRCGILCSSILTGCFCCFCCCCCLNFCFGKCKPKIPEEDDYSAFQGDVEGNGKTDYSEGGIPTTSQPIITQPGTSSSKATNEEWNSVPIALPSKSEVNEKTQLNQDFTGGTYQH